MKYLLTTAGLVLFCSTIGICDEPDLVPLSLANDYYTPPKVRDDNIQSPSDLKPTVPDVVPDPDIPDPGSGEPDVDIKPIFEDPTPNEPELSMPSGALDWTPVDAFGCGGYTGCGSACQHSHSCCYDDEPYRLIPGPGYLGFNMYGWIDAGWTVNGDSPPSNYNGVLTFNDRDGGDVNQVYFILERVADGSCGLDFGARVDVLYGSDSRFTEATGLETRQNGGNKWNGHPRYGLALPQFYAEAAYDDLSFKVGHFYTIIGYETVMAPDNFFYSHAFTMQYGEPFTHTGGLLTYSPGDWTFYGGVVNGWDNFDAVSDRAAFLGGVSYGGIDGLTATYTCIAGSNPTPLGGYGDTFMQSIVVSAELGGGWQYVIQSDLGIQNNGSGFAATENAEWYGINQYLYYAINDCWKIGVRTEWFRDDDGARVGQIGDRHGNTSVPGGGFAGNFTGTSVGLNWSPCANLMVRPEVRWDTFNGISNAGPLPYDDGNDDDQFTFAVDAIFHY